jgi:hypothetical protein
MKVIGEYQALPRLQQMRYTVSKFGLIPTESRAVAVEPFVGQTLKY